jgi:isoamylase
VTVPPAGPPKGPPLPRDLAVWPGSPAPLGATWDGEGVNFALFSEHATGVELCLFGPDGDEHRVPLSETTFHVWHGYLPHAEPGLRYGYRVHGPWDPGNGHRFNPTKLLVDPYAKALAGQVVDDPALYAYPGDYPRPDADSAPYVPRSVVVRDDFPWGPDRHPERPWADSVIYEVHLKGFTERMPGVPAELRGTYAGLGHPAAVNYLAQLGVTAVELLPVHHHVPEPALVQRGMTNYWGYNTLGYFAPHGAYCSSGDGGGQVREFKAMVRSLHRAGIEVILDVVYNHTCEGGPEGPSLSFRGIDNARYYRLHPDDPSRYLDYTGCGNTLDVRHPITLQMLMDSLRYWVTEMHVDGFRFDLASALARSLHDVDKLSSFLAVVQQDPIVSRVKLIAEPWDVGEGGYQVGEFPSVWTEWNGRYRDTVRDFWAGSHIGVSEMGYRLSGSSDLYADDGRRPYASINFVTSHDGFTMRDLVTYSRKHNDANGEGNRDGSDDNRSNNHGVEGETDDPSISTLRRRQVRNLMATLMLSTGVPMICAGDEIRRTQGGNNNAYCQDTAISWLDWHLDDAAEDMLAFTRRLLRLRAASPVLRQRRFFLGRPVEEEPGKDLAWFRPDGQEMHTEDWFSPECRTLGMFLDGEHIRQRNRRGQRVVDASYLIWLHAGAEPCEVRLPDDPWAAAYETVLDTSEENGEPKISAGEAAGWLDSGTTLLLPDRSVLLLRAHR